MDKQTTLIQAIGQCILNLQHAEKQGDMRIIGLQKSYAEYLEKQMPSGSGFDAGMSIDWPICGPGKLVIKTSFHHMNDVGFYDGWTEHRVTIYATFIGSLNITVAGRDKNNIKDYISETLAYHLTETMVDSYGTYYATL